MSASKLLSNTPIPTTSTTPISIDGSRFAAARTAMNPIPGQAKICSVTTAPATSSGRSNPKTVMTGISALRNAWRKMIVTSLSPLALAVVMYSLRNTSSIAARV